MCSMRLLSYLVLLVLMLGCAAKQPSQPVALTGANKTHPLSPSLTPDNTSSANTAQSRIPDNAKQIFDNAETLEVLLLKPSHPAGKFKLNSQDKYLGMEILGRAVVRDAKVKRDLLDSLYASIASVSFGDQYMCIEPKHGLRASYKGKTAALLISFRCQNFYTYTADDQTHPPLNAISKSAQSVFDKILKGANISPE
jgi:hypothetical protein